MTPPDKVNVADVVAKAEKCNNATMFYLKHRVNLLAAVKQLQKRVAELEGQLRRTADYAEELALRYEAGMVQEYGLPKDVRDAKQALSPKQDGQECPKCGKRLSAEKIEGDGGIHTCRQRGGGDGG